MVLTLRVWNVQHGSAAHIRTPNGQHIVVDCGSSETESPLRALQREINYAQLDMAIITHPHLDHISDIEDLNNLNPRILVRPDHLTREDILPNDTQLGSSARLVVENYIQLESRYRFPLEDPSGDPREPLSNGGVEITNFCPSQCSRTNLNNHSVVSLIEYAGCKILLPGDNESPSWEELLLRLDFRIGIRDVDVLVAPHHGRDSGFYRELFSYFTPRLTIISDGRSVDTSATARYSAVTQGWTVHKRAGGSEERKCVTTRSDGTIDVAISLQPDGSPSLSVEVD